MNRDPGQRSPVIPRILWLYWEQGFENSPFLVQQCLASWRRLNPDWEIRALDEETVGSYLREDLPAQIQRRICQAHRSDLIRLLLLKHHGGVWADATTLCRIPLDSWLHQNIGSGFFAFHRPGRDRLIANWFLACHPTNPIAGRLYSKLCEYWIAKPGRLQREPPTWLLRLLSGLLNRNSITARLWLHPLISQKLSLTPYFVFHYIFADLVSTDPECATHWRNTPRLSAKPARLIERLGLHTHLSESLRQELARCPAPLFKLNWREDRGGWRANTVIELLLQSNST